MFIRISEIKLRVEDGESRLLSECANILGINTSDIEKLSVYRRSLVARRGRPIRYVYTADVYVKAKTKYTLQPNCSVIENERIYSVPRVNPPEKRPVIVGFGPAGIFCALVLCEAGIRPIIIERGKPIDERTADVDTLFKTGKLNPQSNIQFGEGGAGTFSDGKLNTLVKDKSYRGRYVLDALVQGGAPREILYEAKPHVGTDCLRICIKNIRERLVAMGAEILFSHTLTGFFTSVNGVAGVEVTDSGGALKRIETDTVFLALGHSARDTFSMLHDAGFCLERKPFSVGVRIEHKQKLINDIQYGGAESEQLPAADYKLVCHTKNGRAVYSFCMCPGGYVVAAASEEGGVCTNGMSNFSRDGENANSALLVEVLPSDFEGDDPLKGMIFQRELERRAYEAGGGDYKAPAQLTADFLGQRRTEKFGSVTPTYPRGVTPCDLHEVLPDFVTEAMHEGLLYFDSLMHGFCGEESVMTAIEARSSSPVRIVRDKESMQAVGKRGVYPIGEGAGYAGGIMSAAMDGMKAAEAYLKKLGD